MTRLLVQSLFIEFVTDPPERQDPFRVAVVLFDSLAQSANVHVDGAGRHESFTAPYAIEELIAAEHPVRILNQETQKLKVSLTVLPRALTS